MVTVDQAATAGIGLDHPFLFRFKIDLKNPTGDGLLAAAEQPEVAEFEEAVEAALAEKTDAWLVGWRTERGSRYVTYYLSEELTRENFGNHWPHGYLLQTNTEADPDWAAYRDYLAPTPFQEILIRSNVLAFKMRELGDDPTMKRAVDHTVLFPDPESAEASAAAISEAGFTNLSINGEVVECQREHELTGVTVERVIESLVTAVEAHNGYYEGWGAPIERTPDRPKRPSGLFRRR